MEQTLAITVRLIEFANFSLFLTFSVHWVWSHFHRHGRPDSHLRQYNHGQDMEHSHQANCLHSGLEVRQADIPTFFLTVIHSWGLHWTVPSTSQDQQEVWKVTILLAGSFFRASTMTTAYGQSQDTVGYSGRSRQHPRQIHSRWQWPQVPMEQLDHHQALVQPALSTSQTLVLMAYLLCLYLPPHKSSTPQCVAGHLLSKGQPYL